MPLPRTIFLLACIVFGNCLTAQPKVTQYFEWYKKDYMIHDPAFSGKGDEIVFVNQLSLRSSGNDRNPAKDRRYDSLVARLKKEPRLADPVVSILNVQTKAITKIDYGWAPDFPPDDKLVVYSFQLHPISAKRVLADGLTDNTIKVYDRRTKKSKEVARPGNTYLLSPIFLDAGHILYQVGDTVDGSYGGGVALHKLDINTGKSETIYRRQKNYGKWHSITSLCKIGTNAYYAVYVPADSFATYSHRLFVNKSVLRDFGTKVFETLHYKFGIDADGTLVHLDDHTELIIDKKYIIRYRNGKEVSRKELQFEYGESYLSPNGKYMLYRGIEEETYLMDTETLKKTRLDDVPDTEFHHVKWSRDGRKLAIVLDHYDLIDTDLILLFDVR